MKKRPQENNHHLIWKSLVNEYRIDMKENQVRMNIERHNALHKLFWCLLTPKEQLKELNYLYDSVLSDTARELFRELLSLSDKEFYIDWMVRNGKHRETR
jgi:hypothetical protein